MVPSRSNVCCWNLREVGASCWPPSGDGSINKSDHWPARTTCAITDERRPDSGATRIYGRQAGMTNTNGTQNANWFIEQDSDDPPTTQLTYGNPKFSTYDVARRASAEAVASAIGWCHHCETCLRAKDL